MADEKMPNPKPVQPFTGKNDQYLDWALHRFRGLTTRGDPTPKTATPPDYGKKGGGK